MARPVRVEYANAVYHLTARGNERKAIYHDDRDRQRFLETLNEARVRFGLVIHGFCLMPNHYHLLLLAEQYGYRDGSGVHQVVKRLEEKAESDRGLSGYLQALTEAVSSVKS